MINEKDFEKIKNSIITIDGKDYLLTSKDRLKSLNYHYNFLKRKWIKKDFNSEIRSFKVKTVKKDDKYLIQIDLEKLKQPLVDWFVVPRIIELIVDYEIIVDYNYKEEI